MKPIFLTTPQSPEDLHEACVQLRRHWPSTWPGLPYILAFCQQSLGLDKATDDTLLALNQFGRMVALQSEQQAAGPDTEPHYHNRLHTADVLLVLTTMLHILKAPHAKLDAQLWASALLAAAVAHDHRHPGGVNRTPAEFETASWQRVRSLAKPLPQVWQQHIENWILGTDVFAVAGNHQRVAEQSFVWSAPWCQVLLNEADIFTSATAELGLGLSDALAREWQQAGFAGHANVATPAGRVQFLRSVKFSSPAALALGIQAQVHQQIATLTHQE